MKESLYKSAMDRLKTSEDFKEATYRKLLSEMDKETPTNSNLPRERAIMQKQTTTKRKLTGWTAGIAASAVLALGIFAVTHNQQSPTTPAPTTNSPSTSTKPPIMGKVAVNIDGVISEVSADGKSFKVGDLWVTVTDQTQLGSKEPTAAKPSEELLNKTFKVGDIVSGYTSQDVSTGKVNADVIYNLIAPQKDDAANANAATPPTTGKMAANIDGQITEVSADGKSFKVGDLWVTVTPDTIMGIGGPTAGQPSDELLQKEFKVGNVVSGFTTDDVGTGKVTATRIYNNMAPQQ